jgi:hypothetical protein
MWMCDAFILCGCVLPLFYVDVDAFILYGCVMPLFYVDI